MATFHIWQDSQDKYYWVLKSDENGKTVARSSESYESKQGAENSVAWTRANAKPAAQEDHA